MNFFYNGWSKNGWLTMLYPSSIRRFKIDKHQEAQQEKHLYASDAYLIVSP